jgi:hypothetical protein
VKLKSNTSGIESTHNHTYSPPDEKDWVYRGRWVNLLAHRMEARIKDRVAHESGPSKRVAMAGCYASAEQCEFDRRTERQPDFSRDD